MRTPIWAAVLTCSIGCKGEPLLPDAKIDAAVDAFQQPWWTPRPNEFRNWDIQLAAPFDLSTQRSLYVLDLWDVAPASTISYDDGSTLNVPAGPLAGKIAELHATNPPTKVACMVRAGTVHLTADRDAMKFPGYEASPPDDPTPPAAGSVVGWSLDIDNPVVRWLDLGAGKQTVLSLVSKRIELAKTIGCDAVVLRNNDRYARDGGWGEQTFEDQVAWHEATAGVGHAINLSVGARNSYFFGFSTPLAATYDFAVVESCTQPSDNPSCGELQPYPAVMKAVFGIEYSTDPSTRCMVLENMGIEDGLIKTEALDGSFAEPCAD